MDEALLRPAFPFRSRRTFLRALGETIREAGPVEDVGTIPWCDDGASLVGLPEEIGRLQCASCVLLTVYEGAKAYQRGAHVDLCCSVLGNRDDHRDEHAWLRVDWRRNDPSVRGGLWVPAATYVGAVIVPVER